jgi:DNA-directed RNA polymerase subunit RPC12/RpoP
MIENKDFERPATTRLRCPKCRSGNMFLVESATWDTEWTVVDGNFDRADGISNPQSIDRLDASCRDCGHRWKPRGAWQIDDVCEEIEDESKD